MPELIRLTLDESAHNSDGCSFMVGMERSR